MIKLRIENIFQQNLTDEGLSVMKEEYEMCGHSLSCNPLNVYSIKPYDEEKFRDGKVYEFEHLADIYNLKREACDTIDYTVEHRNKFNSWGWQEIDIDLDIDPSEPDCMVLTIGAHDEWRD